MSRSVASSLSGRYNLLGSIATLATSAGRDVGLVSGHAPLVGEWILRLVLQFPAQERIGIVGFVVGWQHSEALAVVGDLDLCSPLGEKEKIR